MTPFMDFDTASESSFAKAVRGTRKLENVLKLMALAGLKADRITRTMTAGIKSYNVQARAMTESGKRAKIVITGAANAQGKYKRTIDEVNRSMAKQQRLGGQRNAGLRRTAQLTRAANKEVQEMNVSWKSMIRLVAVQLAHRAISALSRGIHEGVLQIIDLQKRIGEIRTISQDRQLAFGTWIDGLREISDTWGIKIADQAEAAYQALSNQIAKGAEALEFVAEANRFAVTAVTKSTTAVQLGTAVLNAYHMEASKARVVFAQFFKVIELGRVRASEMGTSIGDVAVLAGQAGVRVEELGAIISTLTIQGIAWSKANTQVRGILIKLLKPTGEMKKLLKSIGAESGEAAIKLYGFGGFLSILQERTKGSSTELAKYINRIRGISGALALTGPGFAKYQDNLRKIENASKSYEAATEIVMATAGKRLEVQINRIKNYFIDDVGRKLLSWIDKATNGFTILIDAVKFLASMMKYTLAAAVGLVILKLDVLAEMAFAFAASNPYVIAIIAVAAAVAVLERVIVSASEAETKRIETREKRHKQHNAHLVNEAKAYHERNMSMLKNYGAKHMTVLATLQSHYSKLQSLISGSFEKQQDAVKKYATVTTSALNKMVTEASNRIKKLTTNIEKQSETIKGLQQSLGGKLFDIDISDVDPTKKMGMLKGRITALIAEGSIAAIAGDTETNKRIWQEITNRRRDLFSTSLSQGKKREAQQKKIKKLQDDEFNIEQKYNKERRIQERQLENYLKNRKKYIAQIKYTKEAIRRLDNQRFRAIREIATKMAAIKMHHHDLVNHKKRLVDLNNEHIKQLKVLHEGDTERLKKMTAQKILAEKQVQDFKKYYEIYSKFDAGAVLAGGDYAKAKTLMEAQMANFDAMQKLMKDTGAVTGISDKQIEESRSTLVKAMDNLTKVTEAADKHREAAGKRKEITQSIEVFSKQMSVTKQQLAKMDSLLSMLRSGLLGARAEEGSWLYYDYMAAIQTKQHKFPDAMTPSERDAGIKAASMALKAYDREQTYETGKELSKQVDWLFKNLSKYYIGKEIPGRPRMEGAEELAIGIKYAKAVFEKMMPVLEKQASVRAKVDILLGQANRMDAVVKIQADKKKEEERKFNREIAEKTLANSTKIADTFIKLHEEFAAFSKKIKLIEVPKATKALGGSVSAYGSDRVPAMLTPGEFVVNAAQTRQFYSQLVAMNGGMGRFANGGPVTNINGDFNISVNSSGNTITDIEAIGRGLQREIRRGRVIL